MGYRTALKEGTILPFENMPCQIDAFLERGSNVLVYQGHCLQTGSRGADVLIRELFPSHPQGEIIRDEAGAVQFPCREEPFWNAHKNCFLASGDIHRRRLADHPELNGYPLHVFACNNTFYTVMSASGAARLSEAALLPDQPLLVHTERILGLLDALEAYHKCGYLHLNLDPSRVLIMDVGGQEQVFLAHNHLLGQESGTRPGFSSPEAENGCPETADFSTDLYSVTAVFFYCLMGRSLTLEELLRSGGPSLKNCPCLSREPYPVRQLVSKIIRQGLHVLPSRRFRSIGQMRSIFLELHNRILHKGITHWSLWEFGRRSAEEWAANLPASEGMDPDLENWICQGKRRSAAVPALMIVPEESSGQGVFAHILSMLRLEQDGKSAEELEQLLRSSLKGNRPVLLLVIKDQETLSSAQTEEPALLRSFPGLRILDNAGIALP